MSRLFRTRKVQNPATRNDSLDRIAKSFVVKSLRLQQRWAVFMQRQTERLSASCKVILLSSFCLCSGGFSVFLLARGLMNNHIVPFALTENKGLLHIGKAKDERIKATPAITGEEYKKIQNFRRYMDSLSKNYTGKALYDSVAISRPGLFDSLILIENIYESQMKK